MSTMHRPRPPEESDITAQSMYLIGLERYVAVVEGIAKTLEADNAHLTAALHDQAEQLDLLSIAIEDQIAERRRLERAIRDWADRHTPTDCASCQALLNIANGM